MGGCYGRGDVSCSDSVVQGSPSRPWSGENFSETHIMRRSSVKKEVLQVEGMALAGQGDMSIWMHPQEPEDGQSSWQGVRLERAIS